MSRLLGWIKIEEGQKLAFVPLLISYIDMTYAKSIPSVR
jgi:hypothetical protein